MDLELSGKIALVTGSSRGIGFAIASKLRDEGCRVVLNGRSQSELESAASILQVSHVLGDVQDSAGANEVVSKAAQVHGGLDIVVCNVGSGASVAPGLETEEEWLRVMRLNLFATTATVAAARPLLSSRRDAAILCISSICGSEALGAPLAYSAAKAALNSYVVGNSRVLARENIRINALAPGNILFAGSSWEKKVTHDPAAVAAMLKRDVALNRFGRAEEIADMTAFLVSPRAAFATGAIYVLDGGQLRA